jgi:cysteinyl-tRNA synthetase
MPETPLVLYNTLAHGRAPLTVASADRVRMYTCGPTVYRFVHIGNLRTYLLADWLRRALELQGFAVTQIVNITDVGHMRQELVDRGEDKMIAAALKEGRTPAEITAFYTAAFQRDIARLGIQQAAAYPRATDHVPAMIALIERLLAAGCAYVVDGNVYFSVSAFPTYGALAGGGAEDRLEGVRAAVDPAKRDPRDFALWKAAEPGRLMQWPSPWGPGFPGWHIECSAMAMQYLGEELDLHTGGVDNIFPHHEDERAQSEAATGRTFVRHWVHGQHLLVDGLKMAKSTGNAYTLDDLAARGFEPLAFRALCLTVHYRQRMNFTFPALRGAQRALSRLRDRVRTTTPDLSGWDEWAQTWRARFWAAVNADLNLPAAFGTAWRMLRDTAAPERARAALLLEFDRLLGLDLGAPVGPVPAEVQEQIARRETLRRAGRYPEADALRAAVRARGWEVRDTAAGPRVLPAPPAPVPPGLTRSDDVPSCLGEPDTVEWSVIVTAANALDDLRRCVAAVRRALAGESYELLVVDNGSTDGTRAWLEADLSPRAKGGDNGTGDGHPSSVIPHPAAGGEVRLFFADHNLGEAAARNVALRQARGRYVLWLDTTVELTGNPLPALREALADPRVGAAGPFGLRSADLRTFADHPGPEVDALEGYLIAFRRERLRAVGLLDEKYRFYRNLDLDLSLRLRERGLRLRTVPGLPLVRHPHRLWESLTEEERTERSRRNFNRFLHRWGRRRDLLLAPAAVGEAGAGR